MSHQEHLLKIMQAVRAELEDIVTGLRSRLDAPAADNENWRIQDVLAHIALWERVAARKIAETPLPDGEDLVAREPWDIDAFNDTMQERWRLRSAEDVLTEFAAAHLVLVSAVEGAEDTDCAPGGSVWTAIADDGAGHYPVHFPVTNRFASSAPPSSAP